MNFRTDASKRAFAERLRMTTRRQFLSRCGSGVGSVALASLLDGDLFASPGTDRTGPGASAFGARPPHFPPSAKNVIYLNMIGAPSQVDLFDYKPKLAELEGKPVPESYLAGLRFPFISGAPNMLPSPWEFGRHGSDGSWVSSQLPHTAGITDEITMIRSMHTEEINHVPAQLFLNTGSPRMGRPCIGSWVSYGLGSENSDLPAFVVLASGKAGRCGTACMNNGFLPSVYQGVQFRSEGDPVLYLSDPPGVDSGLRRDMLDELGEMNRRALGRIGDPEIETRISSFEMAYRMQTSVPDLMDITDEPAAVHEMYGTEPGKTSFANNCLLARRLVERGVRFIQIYHGGWDHHGGGGDQNLVTNLPQRCLETDRASAALIRDLKQRGLLANTLVIWGGEFGRTPMIQGEYKKEMLGRDHLRSAYSIWMAGGGIKAGFNYGETDELGMHVVKDPVHIHDFQATLLHCLGLDHERLTWRFQGRDFRLTDVAGEVVHDLLA